MLSSSPLNDLLWSVYAWKGGVGKKVAAMINPGNLPNTTSRPYVQTKSWYILSSGKMKSFLRVSDAT